MNYDTAQQHKIDVDGHTVRVAIKPGVQGHTPLIIFNGIGASLELLQPLVDALHATNPRAAIITFDYPGVGESSTPMLPYRFSGLAVTVAGLLDVLGYNRVNVLGLSWGGFLAQQFAKDFPYRCKKLILAATCAGVAAVPPALSVLSIMASPRRYTDPEYAASVAPSIYGGKFRTNPQLSIDHAAKIAQHAQGSTLGYTYQMMAVYWWTSLHWLHRITQPTLVLAGNDDPLIPLVNMQVIASRMPDSTLHVFEDGHLFLLTSMDEAVPLIDTFLR